MNRNLALCIGLLLILSIGIVTAAVGLSVPNSLKLMGEDGDSISKTFTISNTGDVNLTNFVCAPTGALFSDSEGQVIAVSCSVPSELAIGQTATGTMTANIDLDMKIGAYSKQINITAAQFNATSNVALDNIDLDVYVTPAVCEDGEIGSALSIIDIENPDEGDEFKPGEEISIELDVENSDDEDKDVIVEAFLYNLDNRDKLSSSKTDNIEIESGDDETFKIVLEMPIEEDMSTSDTYVIFIKAYEEGDQDQECTQDSIGVDLALDENSVKIRSLTLSPTLIKCGDAVTAIADIVNVGESTEDDVRVELINNEIGINVISDFFDLDEFGDNDMEWTERLTFTIPKNAKNGEYYLDSTVYFNDGKDTDSDLYKITLSGCEETVSESSEVELTLTKSSFEVGSGPFTVEYSINNPTETDNTYTIEYMPSSAFSSSLTEQLIVGAGQTESSALYPAINTNVADGTYSAVIKVKSGSTTLVEKTVSVKVTQGYVSTPLITGRTVTTTYTDKSLFERLGSIREISPVFWFMGDLILAFLIVIVIYLVLSKRGVRVRRF